MDDLWIVIVSGSIGGVFALLGVFLQSNLVSKADKKKKQLQVIEDFLSAYTEYFRRAAHMTYYFEHIDDVFETKFQGVTKKMSPLERYMQMSESELKYQSTHSNFSIGYTKLMLYIKDAYLDKMRDKFANFINKSEELLEKTRNYTQFESLLKNKKELESYKKEMVELFHGHLSDLRLLNEYFIRKKF